MDAALLTWLASFPALTSRASTLAELSDGVQLLETLAQLSPAHCDAAAVAGARSSVADPTNWVARAGNLKRVRGAIEEFHADVLGMYDPDLDRVDVQAIARAADVDHVRALVMSVLGLALECEAKSDVIGRIMALEERVQAELMGVIEQIVTRQQQLQQAAADANKPTPPAVQQSSAAAAAALPASQPTTSHASLDAASLPRAHTAPVPGGGVGGGASLDGHDATSSLAARVDALSAQLSSEQAAARDAHEQANALRTQLGRLDATNTQLEREKADALEQVRTLQSSLASASSGEASEMASLRAQVEALHAQLAAQERALVDGRRASEEAERLRRECRELSDKLETNMAAVASAAALEERVRTLRRKADEHEEQRDALRKAEQVNEMQQQRLRDMEAELASASLLKAQYESTRSQLAALQQQSGASGAESKTLADELASTREQLSLLTTERDLLTAQAAANDARIAELELAAQSAQAGDAASLGAAAGYSELEMQELRSQLDQVNEQYERRARELKDERSRADTLASQLDVANQELVKVSARANTSRAEHTAELDSVRGQLAQSQSTERTLLKQCEQLELRVKELQSAVEQRTPGTVLVERRALVTPKFLVDFPRVDASRPVPFPAGRAALLRAELGVC